MSMHQFFFLFLLLFGRGVSSINISFSRLLFRQFPLTGSSATEPCNLNVTVLSKNCFTVGLSFFPPHERCFPKNASTGSWQNRSLSRDLTPSSLRRYCAISTNECTAKFKKLCFYPQNISHTTFKL